MIALGQIRLGAAAETETKARCIMVTFANDAAALYTAAEEDKATLAKEGYEHLVFGWSGVQYYSAALLMDETFFSRFRFSFFDNPRPAHSVYCFSHRVLVVCTCVLSSFWPTTSSTPSDPTMSTGSASICS